MSSSNSKPDPHLVADELIDDTKPRPRNAWEDLTAETVPFFDMAPFNKSAIESMRSKINIMIQVSDHAPKGGRGQYVLDMLAERQAELSGGRAPGSGGRGKTLGDMVGDIHGGRGVGEAKKTLSDLLKRLMGRGVGK